MFASVAAILLMMVHLLIGYKHFVGHIPFVVTFYPCKSINIMGQTMFPNMDAHEHDR